MIYHTTDWHLDHRNIITYDRRPDTNVEAMNKRIIEETNARVGENDLLINHGDICMPGHIDRDDNDGYIACLAAHLDKLRCKNIIQCGGNHDKMFIKRQGYYVPNWKLFDLFQWQKNCEECGCLYDGRAYADCPQSKQHAAAKQREVPGLHPMGLELRLTDRLCREHDIPMQFSGMIITCVHYSHRVWNKSHRDSSSILLYGHSHGGLPGFKNTFDVGFNIWNRPLSLLEILTDLMPKHNASEAGKVTFGHHPKEGK